jgi:phage host-nuclease inhibitor protein Gam
MKTTTRIKSPVSARAEALTRDEVEALVHEIAAIKNNERYVTSIMDKEIAAIRTRHEPALSQIADELKQKTAAVQEWAEANPAEFAKRKSIDFTSGTIGFRTGTPKLALLNRRWNWATALQAVQNWLPNFIRSVPEIDKEALLAQRDEQIIRETLPKVGLKVVQDESFYVEPNLTPLETRETAPSKAAA